MAVTNKQAAARIVKKALENLGVSFDSVSPSDIASVAEKTKASEKMVADVRKYAKAFLQPSFQRVNNICEKVDAPDEEEE